MLAIPISPFLKYNPKLPRRVIDPRELSVCDNTEVMDGSIFKSLGWSELPVTLDSPAYHIAEHITNAGNHYVCIHTANKFYFYDPENGVAEDRTRVSGDYSNGTSWSSCSYGDLYIFTNGIDPVQCWDASTDTNLADALNVSITQYPLVVLTFGAHLLMFNNQGVTADDVERKAFFWSVPGDPTDFTNTGSGIGYIYEGKGEIRCVKTLSRDTIAIWKSDSVHSLDYVGGTQYFVARSVLSGVGVESNDSVVQVDNVQIALTNNGFRRYDGSTLASFAPEIDPIVAQYYPSNNNEHIKLLYDPYRMKMWVFLPVKGNQFYSDTALVYSFKESSWSRQTGFSTYASAVANIQATASSSSRWADMGDATWAQAIGDSGYWYWGGQSSEVQYRMLLGDTGTKLYIEDGSTSTRHGQTFIGKAETFMFNPGLILYQNPLLNTELVQLDFGAPLGLASSAPKVYIGISDHGEATQTTWYGPYTPDSNGKVYTTLVGRWFTFRVTDSTRFIITSITSWFVKRGMV